ncbi:signal peptidase I [Protaetiibacter intestinalis]|uniref:Signal peptidase I n=1 Tax=Protaetiibacter intestinalis TaxID=2419774 RepID=A0A387BD42_9MICO|nr:signal peptidase I [Protaetiibacter intestinalis]AYF98799.1 signal peptidase I [Protaetiibacter intestinalis]
MRTLRRIGDTLLWVLASVGVLAGLVWAANAVGWVQPLIVVSGSMSPKIATGDLLFAVPVEARELRVGEVATLPNPQTGRYITHRIVGIEQLGQDYLVTMQGDANGTPDPEPYRVASDDRVWHPVVTVPGAGAVLERVLRPAVIVPAIVALVALIGFTMVPSGRRRAHAHRAGDPIDEPGARA